MTITSTRPHVGPAVGSRRTWATLTDLPEVRWAALATGLFALGAIAQLLGAPAAVWWTLYLACYVAGGWEPAWAGLCALRERSLDVDLLMIVAAIAAAAIGQVFDGALLIVIFATSGALESFMTRRTADSVRSLLDLAPERATRLRDPDDDDPELDVVAVADLVVGDVFLVRPGERVGADGVVVNGSSELDQASITGESLPRFATTGHEVYAGSLNGTGALRVRVSRPAAESVVARIAGMVEQASRTKARAQLFIETIESRYAIVVVIATILLVAVPLVAGADFTPTLLRAMTFMIVASPCAVVLATMPPLLSAIANAGRHGVLVKSAVVMEKLGRTTIVAFDKTGTLTEGTPHVVDVTLLEQGPDTVTDPDAALTLAAAAERDSEHPVGRAILSAARDRELHLPPTTEFSSTPGEGVTATVVGLRIRVGAPVLIESAARSGHQQAADHATRHVERVERCGQTAVVVLANERPLAVIALADQARPRARATVEALTTLTGNTPILLTGDNPRAAEQLAHQLGITDVRAGLLPHDKLAHVTELERAGHRVLLVGDGVNDAPAMAAAHLGLALGSRGADLTLQTADAVIVRDDLSALPALIELSRTATRVVHANLAFAVAVIGGLVGWDLLGALPLPLGVAGHEGSTVLVGLNGLRLLRSRAWEPTVR